MGKLLADNGEISLEEVSKALIIIHDFCNQRNRNCEDCPLSNFNDECLVYEYPHLWKVKSKTIVKVMQDK